MVLNLRTKILAMNEYIINDAKLSIEDQFVTKTFEVDIMKGGKYYLSAWVLGTNGKEGMNSLQVFLDDEEIGKIEMTRTGWQSAKMLSRKGPTSDKQISLSFGKHTISFRCKAPEVPEIEFIHLSKRKTKAKILGSRYNNYINSLKNRRLPDNYAKIREGNDKEIAFRNPFDYAYQLNVGFNYTFYKKFFFNAGTDVVFETKKANPYGSDPYMYLFRANEPIYLSTWANDDGGAGWQSKIVAHIKHTDVYILLVRAYNSNYPRTSDLWKDGSLYVSDIPVAGKKLYCGNIVTSEYLNFFTANLIGDSLLWLQSFYTGNGIVAYNDDYHGSGDFYWAIASRIKAPVYRIRYAIISAYSSYSPAGTCDVYMGCKNSTIMSFFPNLKADDAIRSAPESSAYNCISWAGGRTDLGRYFWPPEPGNPWKGSTDLESFDNFFGNTKNGQILARYHGAMNYTRSGANSSNAFIALWALNGSYTHGSVTKQGNNQPHGYDWESKPGGLMRTFHPRDALEGHNPGDYGHIVAYYRWDGTYAYSNPHPRKTRSKGENKSMDDIEKTELNRAHREKLHELIFVIPEQVVQEFEQKYQAWKETWRDPKLQIHSNPRVFAQSNEYYKFLSYCQEKGKIVWPLIFRKHEQGDDLVINVIEDLTFPKHSELMGQIMIENLKRAEKPRAVVPSQTANWTKYIINLTSQLYDDYKREEGKRGRGQ